MLTSKALTKIAVSTIALCSVSLLADGCGDEPAPEEPSVATDKVVAQSYDVRALYSGFPIIAGLFGAKLPDLNDAAWKLFEDQISTIFNDAKSVTSVLGAITGGISTATTVLQMLGILAGPVDEVANLKVDIDAISTGDTWQKLDAYVDTEYSMVLGATKTLNSFSQPPAIPYNYGSPGYQDSVDGTGGLALGSAFYRTFIGSNNDASTDGKALTYPTGFGESSVPWKSVVPGRPSVSGMNLVYDWRVGVPLLMKATAMRLLIMHAVEPNFRMVPRFHDEITAMRKALADNYQLINDGLQCASQDYAYVPLPKTGSKACNVVCADIYTGISALSSITPNHFVTPQPAPGPTFVSSNCAVVSNGDLSDVVFKTRQVVASQTPLFELKAMIELLDTFLHPKQDLAQHVGRIELQAQQNMCLDVTGADPTPGVPLELYPCNGSVAQSWAYDRTTGQIRNPALGTCVDVLDASPVNGATVRSWTCATPHGTPPRIDNAAQKWTYDADAHILTNALGTRLASTGIGTGAGIVTTTQDTGYDIAGAFPNPAPSRGMPVAQLHWHADQFVKGDMNLDNRADIELAGGSGWWFLPVGLSNGDGSFGDAGLLTLNTGDVAIPSYSTQPGARPVAGDFDGDGKSELALTGGPGWTSIPVAFSAGDGSFRGTNGAVITGDTNFPAYAAQAYVTPLAGDFDGDGRSDVALTGGSGWNTIPVAFSIGDGTFNGTNLQVTSGDTNFTWYATLAGAKHISGDFDGDGKSDVALVGGLGWGTIPVAFSNGDGSFNATNGGIASGDTDFPSWASTPGVKALTGDFDGDGKTDIALVGVAAWGSIPIAFSNGDGTFRVANVWSDIALTAQPQVKAVAGDFNGDGKADIAFVGVAYYGPYYIRTAFSNGDGTFNVGSTNVGDDFASFGSTDGVTAVSGF